MPKVTVTIDGQEVLAEAGSTVLEAATAAGIDIPTLCHHPALAPVGNCRMCLVEIERQRNLQPSCVFPISDGMVVHTHSDKVMEARRFVLELILSDHAFYCMYCEMSGDCELQDLAYEYGIDAIPYPYNYAWEPVDASRENFIFDSKRCILCRRCVRACDEIVANETLGIMSRGFDSKVIADMDVPFAESSCISCGTCLQVCPTGALTERLAAYRGRTGETEQVVSICAACGVGCGMVATTRSNTLVHIRGDWDASVNAGLLCVQGRFEQLEDQGERFQAPLVRRRGQMRAVTWDEALDMVADNLDDSLTVLASPMVTNEALDKLADLADEAGDGQLATFVGRFPEMPEGAEEAGFQEIEEADYIVLVNADLTVELPVVASFVKQALKRGAHLSLVDDNAQNGMAKYARQILTPAEVDQAIEVAERADNPFVLYGADTDADTLDALGALADKARFVRLIPGTNTRGAYERGFGELDKAPIKMALIWAADSKMTLPEETIETLAEADFVVLHTAYETPLTDVADIILPAAIWAEKSGHLTSSEGQTGEMAQILEPAEAIKSDETILDELMERLS
jgi:formate dehydrogenase major subunit